MSDELLERAARALADAMGDNYDHAFTSKSEWNAARGEKGGRYRDINEPRQSDYLDGARAVIQALYEPTPAQLDRFVSRALCVSIHGEGSWTAYARNQWQTMMDALLSPPPQAEIQRLRKEGE